MTESARSDDLVSDEFGIWTTELETWMRKSLMVDHTTSKVFARTADGQLMAVTSVRIDSIGDMEIGLGEAL